MVTRTPIEIRDAFVGALPTDIGPFTLRRHTREDIDRRCCWPPYPAACAAFDATLRDRSTAQRNERHHLDTTDPERLVLGVSHPREELVAVFALMSIQWREGIVGTMGIRVHPDWCDRGNGTLLLDGLAGHCARHGLAELRLDVVMGNTRARRCYEKAGFEVFGEFDKNGEPSLWMRRCMR